MADTTPASSVPYGEVTLRWWETSRADPEEAQDWLTEQLEALAERLKRDFPTVVARVETET